MEFQFSEEYKKLSTKCPPENYTSKNMTAFRWVFEDINDTRNFLPVFFRNPKKYLDKTDFEKCNGLALSFYNSEYGAKSKFEDLKSTIGKNVYKNLGTNIAKGHITELDGINEEPYDRYGHFNHHPSKNCQYHLTFIIISKL
jgi:hypothetical protein